jgi:hypothetical protein
LPAPSASHAAHTGTAKHIGRMRRLRLIQVKSRLERRIQIASRWRTAMSMFETLYLLGAIFAFVTLAALLAWDEYRAGHSSR